MQDCIVECRIVLLILCFPIVRLATLDAIVVVAPETAAYAGAFKHLSIQVSFDPIIWLMVSEIFPLRTRGKGISLSVLTIFGSNAMELLEADNLFLLFGATALLSLLFVSVVVPETKGLTLEEIESKILR